MDILRAPLLLIAALLAAAPLRRAAGADEFDVRRHLSTVTRHGMGPALLARSELRNWIDWHFDWKPL
ncbi:hypothetical protein BS78_03G104800 [Paspalum vaginatum]|nr:hypothetical protein BS78_03G104800 [Paspalum vaginatum]